MIDRLVGDGLVNLRVAHVVQGLHKNISISLMDGNLLA